MLSASMRARFRVLVVSSMDLWAKTWTDVQSGGTAKRDIDRVVRDRS
jgi:hypothetical protein